MKINEYDYLEGQELHYIGFKDGQRLYDCPMCGDEIGVNADVFYGRCPACRLTVMDYSPLPHQMAFHESDTRYRLNLGGYGTGKTTMSCAEVVEHVLTVPNGRTLITGPTLSLVKEAIIPELEKMLPPWYISHSTKSPWKYDMMNGHEIIVLASNDEQNLRSLNLTMFYMEEASNIKHEIFVQLQARLRNEAGFVYDENMRVIENNTKGIVSSNPEQGWLVDEFLLYSKEIHASDHVDKTGYQNLRKGKSQIYESFLSSSRDNIHLPPTFIEELSVGKSPSWISKYIDCSLEIREGAVYPEFLRTIVPDFPIPTEWKKIIGFDKGIRDPTSWLIGAIDPKDNIIYIYKEYAVADRPVSFHAENAKRDFKNLKMYNLPQADPSILQRNDRDARSYQEYFMSLTGIFLEPANNSIDAGLSKVRDYMHLGKIKLFESLVLTKTEAQGYVFKDKDGKEQPIDRNNHLMDCLRYMIMPLPQNPGDFNPFHMQDTREYGNSVTIFEGDVLEEDDLEYDDYGKPNATFGIDERW